MQTSSTTPILVDFNPSTFAHTTSFNHPHIAQSPTDSQISPFCADNSSALYADALALLQRLGPFSSDWPLHTRNATAAPLSASTSLPRHDSAVSATEFAAQDWQMYQQSQSTTGGPATDRNKGLKRTRSHQRTPSASTVASNGPRSPFMQAVSYPYIANTDQSPNSPGQYVDSGLLFKNLPTPSQTPSDPGFANVAYTPGQAAHITGAHLAMKDFAIDHHLVDEYPPDFAPSRQSMSSYGNDSPATPQSGAGDMDAKPYTVPTHDSRSSNPNVQLYRTESQAYQDELYNPNAVYAASSTPVSKPAGSYLSPHRNLITARLETANSLRSASPTSAVSRERSPFRDGSPLAPSKDWKTQAGVVGTAAGMRRQQKEAADLAEYAQHIPPLRREATKTISPKDALLEYTESEQPSLFQDTIPAGYKQHMGGSEHWPTNFMSQPNTTYGGLQNASQQSLSFRPNATSADAFTGGTWSFPSSLPPSSEPHIQSNLFQPGYSAVGTQKMNYPVVNDDTPEFPASLPSMETSISSVGPGPSSEDTVPTLTTQRPTDTRANTGTFTCTYHGCTQRFNSPNMLQKHKRDFHRSQLSKDSTSTSGTASASPRSTESPAPSSSGMTSAAILARNSQAGPHKCTRINPSTNKPCNTIFSRPYDLTRHEDTIHNNRKQKVRCPMCREEKTFSRNDALTRHMRVVHPEVEAFGRRGRRGD